MDPDQDVLLRRALKASREKARRSRRPGYVAREDSQAAVLRRVGVSSDAHYSRLRRERLKAERARDGVSCPPSIPLVEIVSTISDGVSCPVPAVPGIDGVSCRLLDDRVSDGNSCSPWSSETADLQRRVRRLPGGRDPAFLDSLARLVANAPAARAAWGECDPELAALIACND